MVDVQSVGAGGGSIARVRQGALLVGPETAGSTPGPVCYGRGGDRPTVTDADAVLGYLPADGFAGGRMDLDVDAARAAIERDVAEPLGLDLTEAAWGIERIVNANMANATRRVLAGYGADPRDAGADRLRRQRAGARARRSPPSSASTASSCPRPRPRSPPSACSSPTTWSTWCAPT